MLRRIMWVTVLGLIGLILFGRTGGAIGGAIGYVIGSSKRDQ